MCVCGGGGGVRYGWNDPQHRGMEGSMSAGPVQLLTRESWTSLLGLDTIYITCLQVQKPPCDTDEQ